MRTFPRRHTAPFGGLTGRDGRTSLGPVFMRTVSRVRWRSTWGAFALCRLLLGLHVDAGADTLEAVLYRIFLSDGSTIVSYGEYSRVGDQVVFSMPLGAGIADPGLQLVSIPSTTVNWMLTERYADLARAVQLARTSVTFRQDAVQSGNMDTAWDASAAASGALMLFAQAQTDLERQLRTPESR